MKIAHIADTHFGKDLKKVNFADADQPFWIERFLEDIVAEQVDVVVMAGDIYYSYSRERTGKLAG